jgi:GT2 family glycosyltransferase
MAISIIIPVYNRPDEVAELLDSLARFGGELIEIEIIIVEDGSTESCEGVVKSWNEKYPPGARYFRKPNEGPGPSRNYGAARAQGDYLVFLDSDVIVPEGWFEAVARALPMDLWGGPDRAAANFTPLQKAIDYAMTSPLTTGGIRGRRRSVGRFFPRSFNMGVRREVFEAVGGFAPMRFGEDIDLSYRIAEAGFEPRLVPGAWVYHKRRTRWRQFFKQVFNSGAARVELSRRHRGTLKPLHLLPTLFVMGCVGLAVAAVWWPWALLGFVIFGVVVCLDASVRTRSPRVGMLAAVASFLQLTGYGSGFIHGLLRGRGAFAKNFYK